MFRRASAAPRVTRTRSAVAIAAIVGLATAALQQFAAPPASAALSAFSVTSATSAPDFASDAWHDAWDYSNPADIILDSGPTYGASGFSYPSGGILSYHTNGPSYISPLFGGYPGSVRIGRDGGRPTNQVVASSYGRYHIRAYSSKAQLVGVFWFTQDGFKGLGGHTFNMAAGWHDYDFALGNNYPGGAAWAGQIHGLRFSTYGGGAINVQIDYMRVYRAIGFAAALWRSPAGTAATLWYSEGTDTPTTVTTHSGPVVANGTTSTSGGTAWNIVDLGGIPPNSQVYVVDYNGVEGDPIPVRPLPNVVVDDPSGAGCGDYASATLGHPWDFTSGWSVASVNNAAAVTYAGGFMSATNSGPMPGNPFITLPLPKGTINGALYHRVTIVESYDGAFNLSSAAGGGTMARLMWWGVGKPGWAQTADLLTYSGKQTITLDMNTPVAALTPAASPAGTRYPWVTGRILRLRFDPNEDPGARRWHIYSIRLASDCSTRTFYPVHWHDAGYVPGSVATITAVSASGRVYPVGTANETAGENQFVLQSASIPAGTYSIRVRVQSPVAIGANYAQSPFVIAH